MAKDFSVYVNIGGKVAGSLPAAIKSVESRLNGLTRHFQAQAAAQKAAIAGMMASFKGVAAMAAAGGLAFSLKHVLGDGEELAHEIQALKNAGRSTKEVAAGIAEANKAIRNMPTANLTNSMKILNETTGAFGDYHHAVENLEFNSKLGDVMKNTLGIDDPAHALGSLIKSLEIRGSASDPEKYRKEAGELQRAMTFFGGRLKPEDIYTFATNAQQGIRQLSERSLTKIFPSLIQEIGGDKAGTGLTAFRTIISGRKITDKKQAQAWQDLGLLAKNDIIKNKQGDVTGWKDGAIQGTKLAYQDPLEFMETVILPRLKDKQKVDIADPIKLGAALTTLFKNTKANAFVTAISTVVDRARLHKDEKLIEQVLSLDRNYNDSLQNDPKLAKFAIVQAMRNIGAALSMPVMATLAQNLIAIAESMNRFSAYLMEHPETAKIVTNIAMALSGMAALRLAGLVFGLSGLARALGALALASTFSLAARLVALARGITVLSVAASASLGRRLALTAGGLLMMTRVGGAGFALSAIGASLVGLGRSVLMFPVVALRAVGLAMWGLVANPVGIAITAIVVALTALGIWVANNWGGLKGFFLAFGESFSKALGPGAADSVNSIVSALKSVWDWVSKLLGPIDESGVKWVEWGATAGRAAASVVNALVGLPGQIAALFTDFDWASIGTGIGNKLKAGIGAIGGWIGGKLGLGGDGPAPAPLAGARAMGGSVTKGGAYLVGERGPEIFVPNAHGSVRTNGFLNGIGQGGGPTVDATAIVRTRALASEAGSVLHSALDATRKPIIDTSSIDEAVSKVASLGSAMSGLGGGLGGNGGGGRGGAGGGGLGGGGPIGQGAGVGHIASKAERAAFIQETAKSMGMDGKIALRVAQSEGFNKYTGDYGTSFGDFQLHTGGRGPKGMRVGGLGDIAMRRGINIHDPKTWKEQTKFALEQAKAGGWGPWHGWHGSRWAGIRGARAMGGPVAAGSAYLVGERGPELFTPGASGAVSTAAATRILSAGNGSFVPSPEAVARNKAGTSVTHTRGDSHYSPAFTINGARDVNAIKQEVEGHFWEMVRQAESDQRGLLSD